MPNEYVSKRPEYYRLKIDKLLNLAELGLSKRNFRNLCEDLQQVLDERHPDSPLRKEKS